GVGERADPGVHDVPHATRAAGVDVARARRRAADHHLRDDRAVRRESRVGRAQGPRVDSGSAVGALPRGLLHQLGLQARRPHPGGDRLTRAAARFMAITLRTFADSDLDALFTWESDPRAVQMVAFTRANPFDRDAFDAHYERVRSDPSNTLLAIEEDGEFVGTVGNYTMEEKREVTYWT